jgi:polyribonucleotide nucleotidyltransferase
MQLHTVTIEIGGRPLTIETGKYAKQASGAVVVRQNDSAILVTAVSSNKPKPFDFLPLTVDYQDRDGSRGTIPGSFHKREGRSNERETLISRVIDRPIRPQFPKHYRNEIQIIATTISYDTNSDTDILALCGASAALHISDIPMQRPIAGVRVSLIDGALTVNPSREAMETAELNLIVAGTAEAICMVEGGGNEVQEDIVMDALDLAHSEIKKILVAIEELRAAVGQEKQVVAPAPSLDEGIVAKVFELGTAPLNEALGTSGKHERKVAMKAARNGVISQVTDGIEDAAALDTTTKTAKKAWDKLLKKQMRTQVIAEGRRIDGRATDEIRDIWCEVGVSVRAHGSAIFTRGETQALVTAALGVERDAQRIDYAGAQDNFRRWMLTYSFPPFSTGEARMMRGPKRREIGHGVLAHRALAPVIPNQEEFPYVLRCCADVLESNGSSSMATVCGSTLALMDAGVPLKAPVAGIAMGLIKEGDDFAILSDILGDEDHLGDMDFKVTGTAKGITAFQMDTKIDGIPREVMLRAMNQAREGRLHILDEMALTIAEPREELSEHAPRITSVRIKSDKIRDLIGPGGRMIRSLQEQTGTRITVDDSGKVDIASTSREASEKAIALIRELTQEAEIGKLYLGIVKRTVDFGAFVEIFPGTEGLVHISHLAHERVAKTTDIIREGDEVLVRVIDIDRGGKVRLSRKEALDQSNEL